MNGSDLNYLLIFIRSRAIVFSQAIDPRHAFPRQDLRAPWVGKNLLYQLSASANPWRVARGRGTASIRSIFIGGRRRWWHAGESASFHFQYRADSRLQDPRESRASVIARDVISGIRRAGCRVDFYADVRTYWNAINWIEIKYLHYIGARKNMLSHCTIQFRRNQLLSDREINIFHLILHWR